MAFEINSNKLVNLNTGVDIKQNSVGNYLKENTEILQKGNLSTSDNSIVSNQENRFVGNDSLTQVMNGKKSLTIGSKGDDVKLVQEALSDMGFYTGDVSDGKFGKQTSIAIKNFQDNRNLPVTGILDKQTMTELSNIAPPPSKKLWEMGANANTKKLYPSSDIGNNLKARAIVDLSEHRLFLYNQDGTLKKVYSVATGKNGNADGKGGETTPGIKKLTSKNSDPTAVSLKLWPDSKGRAFGTKLMDLSWFDPATKKITRSGQELHGTYTNSSIGTNASHGCMRMLNKDVEEVYDILKTGDIVKVQK